MGPLALSRIVGCPNPTPAPQSERFSLRHIQACTWRVASEPKVDRTTACDVSRAEKWLNRAILDTSHNRDFAAPAHDRSWHEATVVARRRDVGSWGMNGHGRAGAENVDVDPEAAYDPITPEIAIYAIAWT